MSGQGEAIGDSATVAAELTHAVADEMAMHLEDVIVRRTNLGSGSHPGSAVIEAAASLMQPLRGWTEAERRAEVASTEAVLRHHLAAVPGAEPAATAGRAAVTASRGAR